MKLSYIFMPLATIISSALGRFFTDAGMAWYATLKMPAHVPPNWVFPVVWNIIFVCITVAAIRVWEHGVGFRRWLVTALFFGNLFCISYWCYLFFYLHKSGPAIGIAILNLCFVLWGMVLSVRISRLAALLLLPNATWLMFAIYLNYHIWKLNAAVGIYRFL